MECSNTVFKTFAYELLLGSLAFTKKRVKHDDFHRLPFERPHNLYEKKKRIFFVSV